MLRYGGDEIVAVVTVAATLMSWSASSAAIPSRTSALSSAVTVRTMLADLRDPDRVLAEAARVLDFTRPIAITMLGVVIFITDHDEAFRIVGRLVDALPSGSHLAMTHTTNAINGPETDEAVRIWNEGGSTPMVVRSLEQIGRFFHGLELLEPGVVPLNRWRPDPTVATTGDVDEFCAVDRKP